MLFFIFNGDSIARLSPDGSAEELIHVGGAPADLAAAPDGGLLAYTAQGSGSAREIFVISPDGRYAQQVSCLGYARVLKPAWSPDGQTVAFAASQTADGPLGIYTANFAGSGQCPTGNNQRQIVQVDDSQLDSIVWDRSGGWLFFSHGAISAVNPADGRFYAAWIPATGYGPNRALAHHPAADTLVYLKANRDSRTGQVGGMMFAARTGDIGEAAQELPGTPILARRLRYSRDGRFLLIAAERDIWVQDERSGSSLPLVQGGHFDPQPVLSPDAGVVAYIDGGRDRLTVPQVFVISRIGGEAAQLTFHQEGSITDLTWAASSDDA
jgi:Tol biopolymer transport system component